MKKSILFLAVIPLYCYLELLCKTWMLPSLVPRVKGGGEEGREFTAYGRSILVKGNKMVMTTFPVMPLYCPPFDVLYLKIILKHHTHIHEQKG